MITQETFRTICQPLPRVLPAIVIMFLALARLNAQDEQGEQADSLKLNPEQLLTLSFEDLMNVRVITPTLNLQKSGEVPATVMVVTGEQIRLRGYRNLAQLLNDLPDVKVNDKSDPQMYNVVNIRGLNRQDYFVIMLDGIRISSPTNEPLPILENFPIYLAQQIEIVYGPGSALYGADAMAGVINIITKKADSTRPWSFTAMGGTQGYSNATALFSKKFKNDLSLSVGGQYSYDVQPDFSKIYKDQFDMTSQRTGVFNTSYGVMTPTQPVDPDYEAPIKTYNLYASLEKDGFSMKVLHHYTAVPSSTTLKPDNGVYNKEVFYGHSITMASAGYTVTAGKLRSVSTLVGSIYSVDPKSNFRNLFGSMAHGYKYSRGSMLKVEEQLNYSFSEKANLVGGLTYEIFQSVPKSPELQAPIDNRGAVSGILLNSASASNPAGIEAKFFPLEYTNVGSYLQAQYFPTDKVSLTMGVRYDNNSRYGSTVNPRAGLIFHVLENTTLKALYGTAFWAPSPMVTFESYGSFYTTDGGDTYRSSYWHLPNPDLKPVTSQTAELSIHQKVSERTGVTLTAYRSQVDNVIHDMPDNGNTNRYSNKFLGWDVDYIEVPFNRGSQLNYGGSLLLNNTFSVGKARLNAYASVSYVEGTVSEPMAGNGTREAEQQVIAPWQTRLGLDGRVSAFYFSVRLLQSGRQRTATFTDTANPYERQTISGYSLLNMSAGYTLNEHATFFVNVQNALDQRYYNTLEWEASSPDASSFNSSVQDPLRVMAGIRASF